MIPATATENEAKSVARKRKSLLMVFTGQPNDWATSSPRARRFISGAKYSEMIRARRK